MRTIGTRLALAFSCVIIFMAAQGLIAYFTTGSLSTFQQELMNTELQIKRLQNDLAQIRLTIFKLLGTMNPDEMDNLKSLFISSMPLLSNELIELGISPVLVENNRIQYEKIIALHYDFSVKTARSIINGPSKAAHEALVMHLQNIFENIRQENRTKMSKARDRAVLIYACLLLAALVSAMLWAVILARSLTDRGRAEEALKKSEANFRTLVESLPVAVAIAFRKGKDFGFRYVNHAFEELTGYSKQEAEDLDVGAIIHPDMRETVLERARDRLYGKEGVPSRYEMKALSKSGDIQWIDFHGMLIRYEGTKTILTALIDMTRHRRVEAQLRQSQKMEAMGILAGGIAHDFNNILSAVIGYSEIALLLSEEMKDNSQELNQILQAGERARKLVRQILTFSRKTEADLRPVNLNVEVKHVLEILKSTLPKMIEIHINLDPDLKQTHCDPNQIEQVLLNLATNAADAMTDGGRLSVETSNVLLEKPHMEQNMDIRTGEYVLLQVSDTGIGMDEETREFIFDPFYTTKDPSKGTGLGLSTVFGIVKNHKGYINCYSEPGMGSTFKIYLPVYTAHETVEAESSGKNHDVPGGTETILLVDDEQVLLDLGKQILAREGYKTIQAASGEEALALYRQKTSRISLVILDLNMPGMGGHKCLAELLTLNPDVKVLIASGYSAEVQAKDTLKTGAAGFIQKPFLRNNFLKSVRNVLDSNPSYGNRDNIT